MRLTRSPCEGEENFIKLFQISIPLLNQILLLLLIQAHTELSLGHHKSSYLYIFHSHFLFLNPYPRISSLSLEGGEVGGGEGVEEREGERERNISVRETQISCLPMCPDRGWNLQPRYTPWPEIEPANFWRTGRCFNQLSHPARQLLL